jgi:uncharacterized membrane protein
LSEWLLIYGSKSWPIVGPIVGVVVDLRFQILADCRNNCSDCRHDYSDYWPIVGMIVGVMVSNDGRFSA